MSKFSKSAWISGSIESRTRKAIPIMSSPGIEMNGFAARDVFTSGDLEYRCIATLAERYPADFAVTFMDLSLEAEAFGAKVVFNENEPPCIEGAIATEEDEIDALEVPEVGAGRTGEVLKCVRKAVSNLGKPVLAGMIGPYSLAGRLADMTEMMMMAAAEPETAHKLLGKVSAFLKNYLIALKEAGAAGVIIAEPAAGLISPDMCGEFSAEYLKPMIEAVKDDSFMVVLHNCGRTEKQVAELLSSGADALHIGNAVDILDILKQVPADIPVMGNLDPVGVFRTATAEEVYAKTKELLERTSEYPNYILSSGCDLPPAVPAANLDAFFHALADYNAKRV